MTKQKIILKKVSLGGKTLKKGRDYTFDGYSIFLKPIAWGGTSKVKVKSIKTFMTRPTP